MTGGHVELRVRDDGSGIAPDMLHRVFDLFTQEHQALDRSKGGLGIGLAIVKNLVAMHDGSVTASSDGVGRGSTFVVSVPIAPPLALASEAVANGRTEPKITAAALSGRRVLVVDDNVDAAELISEMLRVSGHDVVYAHDGPSALRVVETFKPDVALLDIGLPVMDGYELARRLRAMLGTVRLVALTGYGQQADRNRAFEAGFDFHMVKPVDLRLLRELVLGGDRAS